MKTKAEYLEALRRRVNQGKSKTPKTVVRVDLTTEQTAKVLDRDARRRLRSDWVDAHDVVRHAVDEARIRDRIAESRSVRPRIRRIPPRAR